MVSNLEFKGKDVDEAITQDVDEAITLASEKLGLPREELNIEILSTGSSGIFGLCRKQAVIRVTKKTQEPEPVVPQETISTASQDITEKTTPPAPLSIPPPPFTEELPVEDKRSLSHVDLKERELPQQRLREAIPPLSPDVLLQIKSEVDKLLNLMGFPSEIEINEKNGKAQIKIYGDHVEDLISKEGQALDSIQYLMRKIIGKKIPQRIMFSIDAGEFRKKRKTELQELALKLAKEVKETEKTRTIPPLNPAERRVVHLILQEDKTIRSRSVGEGLFKKILIYLPGKGRMRKKPQRRKGKKDKLTIPE